MSVNTLNDRSEQVLKTDLDNFDDLLECDEQPNMNMISQSEEDGIDQYSDNESRSPVSNELQCTKHNSGPHVNRDRLAL